MRCTQVYILRLLVDSNRSREIQGALEPVDRQDQYYPFQSGQTLLELLCWLSQEPDGDMNGVGEENLDECR